MKYDASTRKRVKRLPMQFLLGAAALTATGCTTLHPVTVAGLRSAVGSTVPGTRGATLEDQNRIDEHVARGCASGVYTADECNAHTVASQERRQDFAEQTADERSV